MTCVLAALILAIPVELNQKPSIWTEMKLKRTGSNGYEEYLDAIDEYRSSGVDAILTDRSRPERTNPTDLQLCRIITEKMRPVTAKIELGNQKQVFEPYTVFDSTTTFPQLSVFRQIVKGIDASVRTAFASGATASATSQLLAAMQMGDNTGRGSLISNLVMIALHQISLRSISRNWNQFSNADAIHFEKFVNQVFLRPNSALESMKVEFSSLDKMLRFELPSMKDSELNDWFASDDDDSESQMFIKQWKGLSFSQRQAVGSRAATALAKQQLAFERVLSQPEKNWVEPNFEPIGGMEGHLIDIISPVYSQFMSSSARQRTQLRLLRLHAIIRQFRFEHDRIPESLQKLNKPTEVLDPLTGESFTYEPEGDLMYELYSKGSDQTGRIDLYYKRSPKEEEFDPNLPPRLRTKYAHYFDLANRP